MKILLSLFILCLLIQLSFSQVYKKGDINAGLGIGFGVYGGKSNDNTKKDTTAIDAACGLIPVWGDISVSNEFAAGLQIERNGFIKGKDTAAVHARSFNFHITAKYRFVNKEKNVLYANIISGYSYLTLSKNTSTDRGYANGYDFQIGLGWEHYFSEKIGMFISGHYALYKFYEIYNGNYDIARTNNNTEDLQLRLSGVNIRTGLLYKF
ncbi:MAG: outer membrane beta-barrel protein [Bacteroidetes bacterium]|nr:outer membrane beta-barrel protein [Bacteroidota bacterium]